MVLREAEAIDPRMYFLLHAYFQEIALQFLLFSVVSFTVRQKDHVHPSAVLHPADLLLNVVIAHIEIGATVYIGLVHLCQVRLAISVLLGLQLVAVIDQVHLPEDIVCTILFEDVLG